MDQISFISRDGLSLVADCIGPNEGPVVVLVHGFPDSPHSWRPAASLLATAGYRVIMPWLRGYTAASARYSAEYGVMPAVYDLTDLMEVLGSPPAHLVGHDWGSVVASVHANSQINQWLSLSLLAVPPMEGLIASPLLTWKALPAQLKLSSYMWDMQQEDSCLTLAADGCAKVRALWEAWSPGWNFTEAQFEPVRDVFSNKDCGWAATRYYRALFTVQRRNTWLSVMGAAGRLVIPTIALAGENDGCMGRAFQQAMFKAASANPAIQCHLLSNCGHFLQAERPEETAALLLDHFGVSRQQKATMRWPIKSHRVRKSPTGVAYPRASLYKLFFGAANTFRTMGIKWLSGFASISGLKAGESYFSTNSLVWL